MEVVYRCCCGIDVHKKIIVACLNQGGEQSLREYCPLVCPLGGLGRCALLGEGFHNKKRPLT